MTQPVSSRTTPEAAARTRELLAIGRLFLGGARGGALWALLLLLIGSATEGVSLLLLAPLLQLVQSQNDGWTIALPVGDWLGAAGTSIRVGLVEALGGFCVLITILTLITRAKSIVLSRVLYSAVNGVRLDLFESIGRSRWQFVAGLRTADLSHLLTADIDRIQSAAFNFLLLIQGVILVLVYACVSWIISPAMTAFAAISGMTILVLLQPVRRLASRYGRKLTEQRQDQYRIVAEFLSGMKVARSFNAEQRYFDQLAATLDRTQVDLTRFIRASSVGGVFQQVANVVALSVFIFSAVEWFNLPLTHLIILILLYMRISPRFSALQANVQEILVNAPALQAIEQVQAQCNLHRETASAGDQIPLAVGLRFDRVSFSYGAAPDSSVISNASFTIPAHSITAIIGASGAGKSTIADLLMGLLAPASGEISIDGVLLDDARRRSWRDNVAYVPQETFLLHDTIEANMRLAAPNAPAEAIWEALRAANAERFVRSLPEGLQTNVGDRGGRLSGGERQRIALARALLRRPQLLILDEATNALDWENQKLINRSIDALRGDMAIVMITHHAAVAEFADFVIAIENGSVLEAGATDALMRNRSSRLSRFTNAEIAL